MNSECVPKDKLFRFLEGKLSSEQEQQIATHIDDCVRCQSILESQPSTLGLPFSTVDTIDQRPSDALSRCLTELKSARGETRGSQRQPNNNLKDIQPWLAHGKDKQGTVRIAEYELLRCIGRGGMGVVFHARDTRLQRVVAFKFMSPSLLVDKDASERFLREARSAAAISHPNVVTIHAVGEFHDLPYLVMELIHGESLADRLEARSLGFDELLEIGQQLASGLAAAHAANVWHRDIKPANILLQADSNTVKIVDFGLAKEVNSQALTQAASVVGTPEFMAPEQFDTTFGDVDQRSDLFSLGTVFYMCIAGHLPFAGPTSLATLKAVCLSQPEHIRSIAPATPGWFSDLVMQLLEKRPTQRPQSAVELQQLLDSHSSKSISPSRVITPPPVSKKLPQSSLPTNLPRRQRSSGFLPAMLLVASSLIVVLAIGYLVGNGLSTSQSSNEVDQQSQRNLTPGTDRSRAAASIPSRQPVVGSDKNVKSRINESGPHEVSTTEELHSLLANSSSELNIMLAGESFQWPNGQIEGRTLSLTAAPGFNPTLSLNWWGDQPAFVASRSKIKLVGLSIEIPRPLAPEEELPGVFSLEDCAFHVRDCRFESRCEYALLFLERTETFIGNCDVFAPNSDCIQWFPEESTQLELENNAFVCDSLLGCSEPYGREIILSGNAFYGATVIECSPEDSELTLNLSCRGNLLLATNAICAFYLSDERIESSGEARFSWFHWQGEDNVFMEELAMVVNEEDDTESFFSTIDEFKTLVETNEVGLTQETGEIDIDRADLEDRLDQGSLRPVFLRKLWQN